MPTIHKWLHWRFTTEEQAFWREVIVNKYGQKEYWCSNPVLSTYGVSVWRTIRSLWTKLKDHIQYKVGKGTNILFWKQNWIGQEALCESFPDLFSFCTNPEAKVAEVWSPQGWNLSFRRLLNDWEVMSLMRVAELLKELDGFSGTNAEPDFVRSTWK